jgi:hypothetical protein
MQIGDGGGGVDDDEEEEEESKNFVAKAISSCLW